MLELKAVFKDSLELLRAMLSPVETMDGLQILGGFLDSHLLKRGPLIP